MDSNWFRKRPLFSHSYRPPAPPPPKKKKRFSLGGILWGALKRTCMTLGALVLILSVIMTLSVSRMGAVPPSLPDSFVLELSLKGELVEHSNQPGGYGFGPKALTVREFIDALDYAATDNRVKAMAVHMEGGGYNLAHLDELRRAILRFRKSGKPAVIYASSYGGSGGGVGTYFLASAFDEIWMQPMGILSVPGLQAEVPYIRTMLEKIGVTPQFFTRKEYKTVFESAMAEEMSAASREMTTALIDDIAGYMIDEIAGARRLPEEKLRSHIDTGLLLDHEAQNAGLIDQVDYYDALKDELKKMAGLTAQADEKTFVEMARYIKVASGDFLPVAKNKKAPKVALIYIVGTIMNGGNVDSGSLSDADTIAENINMAAQDKTVQAIVIRVDSPGGSPVAAETIHHAIKKAQDKGKTVIISMGGAAASGGYWVAAPADYIFAAPATLTGSIGVAGGKFALDDLWQKIGVNWDSVSWGENAGIWSLNEPFSAGGAARLNAMMDDVYEGFTRRVAEGRDMDPAAVEEIARGRVWTGRQALERGLVDELGGLDNTLDYTARMLGAESRRDLNLALLPKPKTPAQMLVELMEYQVGMSRFMEMQAGLLNMFEPLLDHYQAAQSNAGIQLYEPVRVQ